VVVEPATDFAEERFRKGRRLWVAGRERTVASARPHGERWVVRFGDVESIEAAEPLRGAEVAVPEEEARQSLDEGGYFLHDLIGCAVETDAGVTVGPVETVYEGSAQPILGVGAAGGEVLVPLVEGICRVVDVAERRIVIAPPDGLLDANVPERRR
jgi:16S rRNA processing protein RimM